MPDADQTEQFSRLLLANQRRIAGFIYTLVQDHSAVDDIMQEVAGVLWRKFDQFEAGTDFGAWAIKVARFSAFEWRRRQSKLPLPMDDDLLHSLAERAADATCDLEAREDALATCLGKLSNRDRTILAERYAEETPVAEMASIRGRTRRAIYKVLARIHRDLLACIKTTLQPES